MRNHTDPHGAQTTFKGWLHQTRVLLSSSSKAMLMINYCLHITLFCRQTADKTKKKIFKTLWHWLLTLWSDIAAPDAGPPLRTSENTHCFLPSPSSHYHPAKSRHKHFDLHAYPSMQTGNNAVPAAEVPCSFDITTQIWKICVSEGNTWLDILPPANVKG